MNQELNERNGAFEVHKSQVTHHEVDGAADFLGLHFVSFHAVPAQGEKVYVFQPSWTRS